MPKTVIAPTPRPAPYSLVTSTTQQTANFFQVVPLANSTLAPSRSSLLQSNGSKAIFHFRKESIPMPVAKKQHFFLVGVVAPGTRVQAPVKDANGAPSKQRPQLNLKPISSSSASDFIQLLKDLSSTYY